MQKRRTLHHVHRAMRVCMAKVYVRQLRIRSWSVDWAAGRRFCLGAPLAIHSACCRRTGTRGSCCQLGDCIYCTARRSRLCASSTATKPVTCVSMRAPGGKLQVAADRV